MTRTLTYLACPYSHEIPCIRKRRFDIANLVAGKLLTEGMFVFSPISQWHPVALECELPIGWEFWKKYDMAFLQASKEIVVIAAEGWRESKGVQAELAIAKEMGIPVWFVDTQGNPIAEPS